MLGFLLARAGIDVVVLEKHADFLRDFRGDTVHPSTMQVMQELGLLDEFLARPHKAKASGRPRSALDMIIAAVAVSHGCTMLTGARPVPRGPALARLRTANSPHQ